jgi:hypothetical protein
MGDFVGAIAEGIGGLVGGSVDAISNALDTIVATLQVALPGPLFPLVIGGSVVLVAWWYLKR